MRAVDFFCGAGGLSRGLLDAGVRVIAGFDIDVKCQKTFERNNRPAKFYSADISKITSKEIWKILGSRRTSDLLFAGCAPCQPFSQHRKRKQKIEDDEAADQRRSATLLGALARLVADILPGQILVENVPGLTRVPGFSTYRRFIKTLRALHYSIAEGVLDAKHFGVPQTRRRYVLIAIRHRPASLPARRFGPGLANYVSVRDAIARYPAIRAGQRNPSVHNHEAAKISELNRRRLASTPSNGGDRRAWPADLYLDCHKGNYEGHSDAYGRMAWDKPAPTLTGRCHSISNGRYGHPNQDRAISLREAASLQTFRDAYIFYGTNKNIACQIGNAVPVKLAKCLGRHILRLRHRGV
jgi:DNA (cytosine-5)-methyltransferase 1